MRLKLFFENSMFIKNHNMEASKGNHSYFLKMNQFGDMVKDKAWKLANQTMNRLIIMFFIIVVT